MLALGPTASLKAAVTHHSTLLAVLFANLFLANPRIPRTGRAARSLTAWAERNRVHQEELRSRFQAASLPSDPAASVRIAAWVYQQTEKANGQVWVMKSVLQHLGPTWRQCLLATG